MRSFRLSEPATPKRFRDWSWPTAGQCDFSNADFRGTDFRGVELTNVIIAGAYLKDADLRGVDLRHVDLEGCSLHKANVGGTYFPENVSPAEICMSLEYGTRVRVGAKC